MIAITEVTRAYNEGNMAAYRESGVVTGKEFQTARDEHVCGICRPLDGKITELEGTFEAPPEFNIENFQQPPVHVNCRCVLAPITRRFQRV
jgi:SPP1 gp7 family putative phage head morphogenesis protein